MICICTYVYVYNMYVVLGTNQCELLWKMVFEELENVFSPAKKSAVCVSVCVCVCVCVLCVCVCVCVCVCLSV